MTGEQDLLQRARQLDQAALDEIFETYYERLYRYIFHHAGRHKATAEDLASEVFHRFIAEIIRGRGPERHLKAWLFRVAQNLIVDHVREAQRAHTSLEEANLIAEDLAPAHADRAVLVEQVRRAMDTLTVEQRSVIMLRFIEGMPHEDIAAIMRTNPGAVRSLQHRALAALRRYLIQRGVMNEEST